MKKLFSKKTSYAIIAMVLVLSMVGGYFLSDSNRASAKKKEITAKERILAKRQEVLSSSVSMNTKADENEVVRAIVTLKAKSVADTNKVSKYNSKLKSKEDKIINNQKSLIKKVEKITGNKVKNQSAYLVNSFSIDATRKQMKKIAKLEGVAKVYEATKYETTMASAVKEGNVKSQWEAADYGYTGEGVVIAVIDTGVNYRHQDMVLNDGVKTKFTKEQWKEKIKLLGHGQYMTEKVPFGYNYTTGKDECLSKGSDHGYHVAGIAAGNGKVNGVAKNAQVLGLKVFSDNGGGAYSDDMVAAIEDAVKLGADVINMSLGSDCGMVTDEDYTQTAISNATRDGIISCIAAGNSGTSAGYGDNSNYLNIKDTSIVSSPSVVDSALSVASADNVSYHNLCSTVATVGNINNQFNFIDLTGYGFTFDNIKLVDVGYGVNKHKKLTIKEKKIKDNIVVVQSGESTFNDKIYYLSKAGAKGIILVSENSTIDGNIDARDWLGVPVILVNSEDGAILTKAAKKKQTYKTISVEEIKELNSDIAMSKFSSWGPTNELIIKPEITAPGGNIVAVLGGTDEYGVKSGTSMATPFTAGSEAVMLSAIRARELNLKGEELVKFMKNSLMNTADPIVDKSVNQPYSVRYQGSGMVDVYGAVDNNVIATYNNNAKVELKEMTSTTSFDITLKNYGKTDATYVLNDTQIYTDYIENKEENNEDVHEYGIKPITGAKITYSTNTITVPAGQTVTVTANIDLTGKIQTNQFIEAFIKFEGQNVQNIGMPVLGFYGDYDAEGIFDKSVYEEGQSSLEEKTGIESATSLAGVSVGDCDGILGTEVTKVKDKDRNTSLATGANVNNDTNNTDKDNNVVSKEDIVKYTRAAIINGLVDGKTPDKDSAIDVKIGDSIEVPILNPCESILYRVKATKDTGCLVDFEDLSVYPVVSVYNSKMELLYNNLFGYFFGGYTPMELSMTKGTEVYIDIENLAGTVGLFKTNFVEKEYDAENDIKLIEASSKTKKINVKENRRVKISGNEYGTGSATFTPKKDSYYTFDFTDMMTSTNIDIYEYVYENDEIVDVKEILSDIALDKYSREIKLNKGSTYAIELDKGDSEIAGKVIAKLKVKASNGDNAYTLDVSYNGENNAFSPNEDDVRDCVAPLLTQYRNAKEIKVKVLDSNKNVIKNIINAVDVSKMTYSYFDSDVAMPVWNQITGNLANWDGTVYNKATGESEIVKDGQYYIQVEAKRTKDSEVQVVTMPVKVDTVAPELTKCDIRVNKKGQTIIEFNVKDNLAMSPYFYIDVNQEVEMKDGLYEESYTLPVLYAQTEKNAADNYEINLGKIKDAEITLMVEDAAGNTVMNENLEDDADYEEYEDEDIDIDFDMEDMDEDTIEGFNICDGVFIYNELVDGAELGVASEDGEAIYLSGECEKDITIEVNGVEAEYEEDEDYLDYLTEGKYFYVECPIEAGITETTINFVAKKSGTEIFNETYNVKLDRVAPKMNILDNNAFSKIKSYPGNSVTFVLLNSTVKDEVKFRVKIEDTNFDEESINILSLDVSEEQYNIENLGNGIYEFTLNGLSDIDSYISISIDAADKACNYLWEEIYFMNDEETFDMWTKMYDYEITTNLDESIAIASSDLNEDGTFTLKGSCGTVPENFMINGDKVCVNPKDRTFEYVMNVNKGINNLRFDITINGEALECDGRFYYEDMKVTFNKMPKANKDGVIAVTDEVFNLSGVISSYMSVASIDINGDNMYTASDIKASSNGKVLTKNFDYNIKLQKGTNIIQLVVKNWAGIEVTKTITVEYK